MIEIEVTIKTETTPFQAEGLIACDRNVNFRSDKRFNSIFRELAETKKEKEREWRVHVFLWAFKNGLRLEGDLIECGVFRGFSSAFAVRYTEFQKKEKKTLYLFDTWEGIPDDQLDRGREHIAEYKDLGNFDKVKSRFNCFENVKLVKGRVPEVFQSINIPEKISFLHLDMNSSIAEIGALEHLFDKMVTGSVCLLDDFGFRIAREQMLVETNWFSKKGYTVCELPTGQGIVVKT